MKNTQALASVVGVAAITAFDGTPLVAAGPLTKQPGTTPYRIVLANKGVEFVVWSELVPNWPKDTKGSYFEQGDYFRPTELAKAIEKFAERVARHAGPANTVYRNIEDDEPTGA